MKKIISFSVTVIFSLTIVCCKQDKAQVQPTVVDCASVTFSHDIAPIINANCVSCHNSAYTCGPLTDYNDVKAKVDNGSLKQRVVITKDMSPTGTLSVADIQKIKCWIDNGAQNN